MSNNYKLEDTFAASLTDLNQQMRQYAQDVTNRVDYIYQEVWTTLGINNHYWDLPTPYGGSETGILELLQLDNKDYQLPFYTDRTKYLAHEASKCFHTRDNSVILDKYGKEINLFKGIPQRWLWEEFETEVKSGRAAYQQQVSEKAKKDALLKKQALNKLSSEEKAVLGLDT